MRGKLRIEMAATISKHFNLLDAAILSGNAVSTRDHLCIP